MAPYIGPTFFKPVYGVLESLILGYEPLFASKAKINVFEIFLNGVVPKGPAE